jgi:hypothetical protein
MDKGGNCTPEPSWPSLGWEGSLFGLTPYDRARRNPRAELLVLTPTATPTMIILTTTPSPKSVAKTGQPSLTNTCR